MKLKDLNAKVIEIKDLLNFKPEDLKFPKLPSMMIEETKDAKYLVKLFLEWTNTLEEREAAKLKLVTILNDLYSKGELYGLFVHYGVGFEVPDVDDPSAPNRYIQIVYPLVSDSFEHGYPKSEDQDEATRKRDAPTYTHGVLLARSPFLS